MASNKKLTDLIDYTTVLPYASELVGIYQPLIGWKSKRIDDRFQHGFQTDRNLLLDRLKNQFNGQVYLRYNQDCQLEIDIQPGTLQAGALRPFDNLVLEKIAEKLPSYEKLNPKIWPKLINQDQIEHIFRESVIPTYQNEFFEACRGNFSERFPANPGTRSGG